MKDRYGEGTASPTGFGSYDYGAAVVWHTVRFVVPGHPRGKAAVGERIVQPKGRPAFIAHYTDSKTAKEMTAIRLIASAAMLGRAPFAGRVEIWVCAYRAMPKGFSKKQREQALAGEIAPTTKPDYDNTAKLQDALKGIVWVDDAQVTDAHLFKRYSDRPRLVVEVVEVPPGTITMGVPE